MAVFALPFDRLVVLCGRGLGDIYRVRRREGVLETALQRAVGCRVFLPGLAGVGGVGVLVDWRWIEARHGNLQRSQGNNVFRQASVPPDAAAQNARWANWAHGTNVLE